MRAIAHFVGISKGDVLLSSYTNMAKGALRLCSGIAACP